MSYVFKTRDELKEAVNLYCSEQGKCVELYGDCNTWDVSNITDMQKIFERTRFNGNISNWNVSNVTNMSYMFRLSHFNGDISNWNVSNVNDMDFMFSISQFNGDISKWDVSNVTNMYSMFHISQFNGDISKWDVSNVTNMNYMFYNSQFNDNISNWNVSNVTNMFCMFYYSQFNGDISGWNITNLKYGRSEIIEIMKQNIKPINIMKALEQGKETCPVTRDLITGDYIQCDTCKKCFDISIKKDWIDKNHNCPHCTCAWTNNTIYSQPQ
jgi:surface protein